MTATKVKFVSMYILHLFNSKGAKWNTLGTFEIRKGRAFPDNRSFREQDPGAGKIKYLYKTLLLAGWRKEVTASHLCES